MRALRIDDAPASPVVAANRGLEVARAELVGLLIDGARLASPGLLATALLAARLAARPVITTPAWHLGPVTHMRAAEAGYDQSVEDTLLAESEWEIDGYRLFARSTLSGSSGRGVFGPMGESNSLFMRRESWAELGGLDEAFALPGGGLANHDLFQRACALEEARLIVLLGEGTFHQLHGGASTSRRFSWDEMLADFEAIRGPGAHRPPENEPLYVGTVPGPYLSHLERSAHQAIERGGRSRLRPTEACATTIGSISVVAPAARAVSRCQFRLSIPPHEESPHRRSCSRRPCLLGGGGGRRRKLRRRARVSFVPPVTRRAGPTSPVHSTSSWRRCRTELISFRPAVVTASKAH